MELALRASEALLQFNPEDPYEIRDRGLIYAQLECDHVALLDLNYFVEQCPEDPISEMIRAQINTISHKTNYIALVDIREIRCAEAILRYDAYLSGMIPVTP
ncbi:Uncharacterised protein [Raoultella terrigena]|uniref:Uncharacterized protein n=1 Tax=Raoultella terrigena TaxID=577 RepID=A0A4U9D272_RAOTE|nr:Uncharacterised protein [Raoultella terrigena]